MSNVGKNICMLLVCGSVHATLDLRITTMDDLPLVQAAIGEPFLIHVRDIDSSGSINQPHVEGLDSFVQQGTNFAMHTINSVSTVIYKYQVRADKAGVYRIGPASINVGSGVQTSNSIELPVDTQVRIDKKHQKKPMVFARLEIDKEDVVVGEKVICTLTLYASEHLQTRVQSIQEPKELKELGIVFHDADALQKGTQQVQGKEYMYGQWRWEFYPSQTGLLTIPAFSIDYTMLTSHNSFFSFMDWWENKRIFSNALQLHVQALAPYDGLVDGIGTFSSYSAELEANEVQAGSAMVLRMKLTGDGNWGVIKEPELKGLNDSIRVYYSSSSTDENQTDGSITKTFEYIVQGLKAEDVTIKPQKFTYFDTQERVFKELTTDPLYATITPAPSTITDDPIVDTPINMPTADICGLRPFIGQYSFSLRIPQLLFILLLMLPLCLCFVGVIRTMYEWYIKRYEQRWARKGTCRKARKLVQQARQDKKYAALYSIFIQVFSDICGVVPAKITSERINELLSESTLEQRAQWNLFFETLLTLRFSYHEGDKDEIFEQAIHWLDVFEPNEIGTVSNRFYMRFPFF